MQLMLVYLLKNSLIAMQTFKPLFRLNMRSTLMTDLIILCQLQTRKTRFNILWTELFFWILISDEDDITGVQTTHKDFHTVKKNLPMRWSFILIQAKGFIVIVWV